MAKIPNPVKRPKRVGTIQGILSVWPVQPNQKSPAAKTGALTIIIGSRYLGTGILLFALSFLIFKGFIRTISIKAIISPIMRPK